MVCLAAIVIFCTYHIAIQGDTLKFIGPDSAVIKRARLGLTEQTEQIGGQTIRVSILDKAYVSENGRFALVYHLKMSDTIHESSVKFFNNRGKVLWQKAISGNYQYNPGCGLAHNLGFAVILRSDINNHEPALYLVSNAGMARKLNRRDWHAIVDVVASENGRFLSINTRRKERKSVWDCLLFIDLKGNQEWSHTFSDCLSCTRPKAIKMVVDEDGKTRVTFKKEVYVFAHDGRLVAIENL
jgi:hypothetical protein